MYISEKHNLSEYQIYASFHLAVKRGTDFIYQTNNFENSKSMQSIANIFVSFIKISF